MGLSLRGTRASNAGNREQDLDASLVSTGLPMAGILANPMFEVAPKREKCNQSLFSSSKMKKTLPVILLSWKLIVFWTSSGENLDQSGLKSALV